jgi:hypothetical protein
MPSKLHSHLRVSSSDELKILSDDTHDDAIDLVDPSEYEDLVSQ